MQRRKKIFADLKPDTFVVREKSVAIPETRADVIDVIFKELKIKKHDWALASLGIMAKNNKALNRGMLQTALKYKFSEKVFALAMETIEKTA